MLVISMALIIGCAGRTTVPEDHFYQLPDLLAPKTFSSNQTKVIIGIDSLRSDGLHGERAILYIDADNPLELKRYHYYHWTDSPPRLVQLSLLNYLRKAGFADNVVRYDPGKQVDGTINGTLLHFERIIGAGGIKVDVALDLEYNDKDQHKSWHKEYRVVVPVKDAALHTSIEAFGAALQQIFDAFATDLMSNLT